MTFQTIAPSTGCAPSPGMAREYVSSPPDPTHHTLSRPRRPQGTFGQDYGSGRPAVSSNSLSTPPNHTRRPHHLHPGTFHEGLYSSATWSFDHPLYSAPYHRPPSMYHTHQPLYHHRTEGYNPPPRFFGSTDYFPDPQPHWDQYSAGYVPPSIHPRPQPAAPFFTRGNEGLPGHAALESGVRFEGHSHIDPTLSVNGEEYLRSSSQDSEMRPSSPHEDDSDSDSDSDSQENVTTTVGPPRMYKSNTKGTAAVEKVKPKQASALQRLIGKTPVPLIDGYITQSTNARLKLNDIYEMFLTHFPVLSTTSAAMTKKWKYSIRTNLTSQNKFVKVERPLKRVGRGDYWTVNRALTGCRPRRKKSPAGSKAKRKPGHSSSTRDANSSPFASTSGSSSGSTTEVASPAPPGLVGASHVPEMPKLSSTAHIPGIVPQIPALENPVSTRSSTACPSTPGTPFDGHDLEPSSAYSPATFTSTLRPSSPLDLCWNRYCSKYQL